MLTFHTYNVNSVTVNMLTANKTHGMSPDLKLQNIVKSEPVPKIGFFINMKYVLVEIP